MPPPAGCEWFTEEPHLLLCVCVLLLQDLLQSCARGRRRRVEDMCYERRRAEACVDESAHHARDESVRYGTRLVTLKRIG